MPANDSILAFKSPLSASRCTPVSLRGTEHLNDLFSLDVGLVAGEDPVEPEELLGYEVTVTVTSGDLEQSFHGIVSRFTETDPIGDDTFQYTVEVVPKLWLLGLNGHNRIFTDMTALDIVEQVVSESCGMPLRRSVMKSYTVRETCCQFNETDLAFVQRLLAEEGVAFCFAHTKGATTLVLADSMDGMPDCAPRDYPYKEREEAGWKTRVSRFQRDGHLCTGGLLSTDYSEYAPKDALSIKEQLKPVKGKSRQGQMTLHGRHDFEPQGFQRQLKNNTCTLQAKRWLQGMEAGASTFKGVSGAATLAAGSRFELDDAPVVAGGATEFLLMSVSHEAVDGNDNETYYRNSFVCAATTNATAFLPRIIPERPRLWGLQTAKVVEVENPEIDGAHARVKVQYPWDSENSSCWARVAQLYAGDQWGGFFVPDVGQEVLVECFNGDPDRPVVVGAVYNEENKVPPYTKWQSGIKTRSGDHNELRFDDEPGAEEVYFQAGRDHNFLVQNDESGEIQHDQKLVVGNNQEVEIGGNQDVLVTGNIDHESKQSIKVKAGMTLDIEAGASITLKVGGSEIKMDPAGITIKSTMVTVKSNAMTEVSSSAMLTLKGALTRIN